MQKIKAVANRYKIQKKLFKINSYIYARIFDKCTLDTCIGCIYIYQNQQPGQILKMLSEKFVPGQHLANLIFPTFHIKDNLNDKSISIFFMANQIIPLELFTQKEYQRITLNQMLKFTYDSLCSLHHLHSHNIIHGNISLKTCYISKKNKGNIVDFALNILDTSTFHQQLLKSNESLLFKSSAQHNTIKTSFKDDAQSMIYVLVHIFSKGKLFTQTRYKQQWVNQNQLLRWKTMDFFKQMVQILPEELQFLSQIYVDIKTATRNTKPDYPKFIKRAFLKLKQLQNKQNKTSKNQYNKKQEQKQIKKQQNVITIKKILDQEENHNRKIKFKILENQKNIKQNKQKQVKISQVQQQKILLIMDEDQEQNNRIQQKIQKLETTKNTFKNKSFLDQNFN